VFCFLRPTTSPGGHSTLPPSESVQTPRWGAPWPTSPWYTRSPCCQQLGPQGTSRPVPHIGEQRPQGMSSEPKQAWSSSRVSAGPRERLADFHLEAQACSGGRSCVGDRAAHWGPSENQGSRLCSGVGTAGAPGQRLTGGGHTHTHTHAAPTVMSLRSPPPPLTLPLTSPLSNKKTKPTKPSEQQSRTKGALSVSTGDRNQDGV